MRQSQFRNNGHALFMCCIYMYLYVSIFDPSAIYALLALHDNMIYLWEELLQKTGEVALISGNPPAEKESLTFYVMVCGSDKSEARPGAVWVWGNIVLYVEMVLFRGMCFLVIRVVKVVLLFIDHNDFSYHCFSHDMYHVNIRGAES